MAIRPENEEACAAFLEAAGAYCNLIDSLKNGKSASFYPSLEDSLAHLSLRILPVENPWSGDNELALRFAMSQEDWNVVAKQIGHATGPDVEQVLAWHEEGSYDAVRASMLWDDLADIYRTLQLGVRLWQAALPGCQEQAAFEWRFGYETHWGRHLFRAMETVKEIRHQAHCD
jgi:hypothetical protein